MDDQQDCFICRKHQGLGMIPGGAVFEDDLFYAGHSWDTSKEMSPYLGSFIVEPKRHIPSWADLNDQEAHAIGSVIRDVCGALEKGLDAEHVYVFVIGHHIPHLHIWVVPRYAQTPRAFWGMGLFDWPQRPIGDRETVDRICCTIRTLLG